MDKDRKLKRYRRKDYSEVVEFPVEIVGRDGVVRHYDFEESVRLYLRRLSFAPMRFTDDDLVAAEQGHCKARIEQLRRSFFHLHGWSTDDGGRGPEAARPDHAGELTAFLLRIFRDPGRVDVRFSPLDRVAPGDLWYLQRDGVAGGLLLYAFAFEAHDDGTTVAYHALLRDLRTSEGTQGDAERLIGFHQSGDCAFVLTGRGEDVAALASAVHGAPEGADEPSPWDEVVEFVRRGDAMAALLRCRSLLELQPWHRDAYALGAALAMGLQRPSDAEDLAFVGTRYLPDDALLHHYLGLSRYGQGRLVEADAALSRALTLAPELTVARSLAVILATDRGRLLRALRTGRLPEGVGPDGLDEVAHQALLGSLGRAVRFFAVIAACALVCSGAAVVLGWKVLVPLGAVLMVGGVGITALARRYRDNRARHLHEDVQVALQRVRRTRSAQRGR
ncbi:MAG: hypothetical protein H6733_05570 [Alphaproteobacteria bacterium]|nr:hypothetical protein [Alphaproteobacteria bacterium]